MFLNSPTSQRNKYLCADNVLMERTDIILKIMTINGVTLTVLIGPSQSSEVVGASLVYSTILTPLFLLIVRTNNG